jgi:hypothetical protein
MRKQKMWKEDVEDTEDFEVDNADAVPTEKFHKCINREGSLQKPA